MQCHDSPGFQKGSDVDDIDSGSRPGPSLVVMVMSPGGAAEGSQWQAQRSHWKLVIHIERALQGREGSPDISLIILNAREFEHFGILLLNVLCRWCSS